jgi:hypothetical protein
MKSKSNSIKILSVIGTALIVALTLMVYGQTQKDQNSSDQTTDNQKNNAGSDKKFKPPTAKKLDDLATPIIDFNNSSVADENRTLKNNRYDKRGSVMSEPNPRIAEGVKYSHWEYEFLDLPTSESDLVIEGKVTDSRAFLSNDKTGVYSEFTVRVSKVHKAASNISISSGDSVVAERSGGRVRYPSGQIIRYRINGQGSPIIGKKYLLFLREAGQGNYKILTGYELYGNKVFALDGSRLNTFGGGGDWDFDKHNDKNLNQFMKEFEEALRNPRKPEEPRRLGP